MNCLFCFIELFIATKKNLHISQHNTKGDITAFLSPSQLFPKWNNNAPGVKSRLDPPIFLSCRDLLISITIRAIQLIKICSKAETDLELTYNGTFTKVKKTKWCWFAIWWKCYLCISVNHPCLCIWLTLNVCMWKTTNKIVLLLLFVSMRKFI